MRAEVLRDLQSFLDQYGFPPDKRILEAGCGSRSHVTFNGDSYLVGIDISERQLAENDGLDLKICGDVQCHDLGQSVFDVIICWEVLEHLRSPLSALENFARATKKHGLVILALPNVLSLCGLVTACTPHWFHVLIYRRVFGCKDAGRDGRPPFPTSLKFTVSPRSLRKFADRAGLSVVFSRLYDPMVEHIQRSSRFAYSIYLFLCVVLKIFSLGTLGGTANSGYVLVMRKE